MAVDLEKMRQKRAERRTRRGQTGDGSETELADGRALRDTDDLAIISFDRVLHVSDLSVVVECDGEKFIVPKSLIASATDQELEVAEWWAIQEGFC